MRALITGVTGQDGSYLAEVLAGRGYEVYGLIRGQDNPRRDWLKDLVPGIRLLDGDLLDQTSLNNAVDQARPDEVYNLGAISSPGMAWAQPTVTAEVTGLGVLRLIEAVRLITPGARIVQASSIANHGPYGAAKLFAGAICADYRSRGMHVSCAVFGGHHSPRRGRTFFSRKVTAAVARIAAGQQDVLSLGALSRVQDWGRADDFMAALPQLAGLDPDDYIMSTGDPHSVKDWVSAAFAVAGLDWEQHVRFDDGLGNVTDVPMLTAQPDPRLGWAPQSDLDDLVKWMVTADMEAIR